MSKQLLFYGKVVPISEQRHLDYSVEAGNDYSFARATNAVPVMAVEIPQAAKEYSIVFTDSGDQVMPAVVLGIENDKNLYITSGDTWDATYIPAFVRRYPFVFTSSDEGKTFTLCIDEEFPGCKHAVKVEKGSKGQRLFTGDGERTEYLTNMLNFVNNYRAENQRTQEFCKRLKELDLFEPMKAQITLPSGNQRSLTGFLVVSRERLRKLDGDILAELARSDSLELIYLHLSSLRNFEVLAARTGTESQAEAGGKKAGGKKGKKKANGSS